MAETAKLMNLKVLIPDMDAGCSLASSITGEDVRIKEKISWGSSVSYVNTLQRSKLRAMFVVLLQMQ